MAELPIEIPQQRQSRRALERKRKQRRNARTVDERFEDLQRVLAAKDAAMDAVRLLTTGEAAELLGVSRGHLEHARLKGDGVPWIKLTPGQRGIVRYVLSDLKRYIAARRQQSTAENRGRKNEPAPAE